MDQILAVFSNRNDSMLQRRRINLRSDKMFRKGLKVLIRALAVSGRGLTDKPRWEIMRF